MNFKFLIFGVIATLGLNAQHSATDRIEENLRKVNERREAFIKAHASDFGLKKEQHNAQHEVVGWRDRTTKHFKNRDGSYTAKSTAGSSLHYWSDNTWKDIDNSIVANSDANYPYINQTNRFQTKYSDQFKYGIEVTLERQTFSFLRSPKAVYFDAQLKSVKTTSITDKELIIKDSYAQYSQFAFHSDLRITQGPDGHKQELIFNDWNEIKPVNAKYFGYSENISIPKDWNIEYQYDERKNIIGISFSQDGKKIMSFVPPVMYEKEVDFKDRGRSTSIDGFYKVLFNEDTMTLFTLFDISWMEDEQRQFPVILDPTTAYSPDATTYWTGRITSSGATKSDDEVYVKSLDKQRGWMKFNVSSISDAATISDVDLTYTTYALGLGGTVFDIHQLSTEPVAASAATIYADAASGTIYQNDVSEFATGTFTKDLGTNADTYLEGTSLGVDWFGVGFDDDDFDNDYYDRIRGYSHADAPYITVTYTTPCSASATWDGSESTDWTDADNWSTGEVPCNTTDVTIPASLSNYPSLGDNAAECADLTVASGASITLGHTSNSLDVYGSIDISGTLTHNQSVYIYLYGSGETISITGDAKGGSISPFRIDNTASYTASSDLDFTHFYIENGGSFNQNGYDVTTQYFFQAGTYTLGTGTLEIAGPYDPTPYANIDGTNPYFDDADFTESTGTIYYNAGENGFSADDQTIRSTVTYYDLKVRTNNGYTATIGSNSTEVTVNNDFILTNPGTAGGVATTVENINISGNIDLGSTGNYFTFNLADRMYRSSGTGTFSMNTSSSNTINITYASASNTAISGFGTPTIYGTTNYNSASTQLITPATYYDVDILGSGTRYPGAGDIDVNNDIDISAGELAMQNTSSNTYSIQDNDPLQVTTYPSPYGGLFQNERLQAIYTVAELTAAGLSSGDEISSIGFHISTVNNAPGFNYSNMIVKLGHTSNSTFTSDAFLSPTFTNCANAFEYEPSAGWHTISFDNNFTWNGTDNILVYTAYDNPDGDSGSDDEIYYNSKTNGCITAYDDLVSGYTTTANIARYAERPDIQFGVTADGTSYNATIAGDWNNDATFTCGASKVTFDGSAAQNITGTANTAFYDLDINNSSGDVTLSKSATVSNELSLTDGALIASSSSEPIEILSTGSINATYDGNDASHVKGYIKMTKSTTSEIEFPIGDGTSYLPCFLTPSGATSETWTVGYVEGGYSDLTVNDVDHVSELEHYIITRSGSVNAKVKLSWDSNSGVEDLDDLVIGHFYSGAWNKEGSTFTKTGNTTAGTIQTDGYVTSFSPFALASTAGLNPLPVSLISLEAYCDEDAVLQWIVAEESNLESYEVWGSWDGYNYELLNIVPANNSSDITTYQVRNNAAYQYFELKKVETNGIPESLGLRIINCSSQEVNFTIQDNQINLDFYEFGFGHLDIVVVDYLGRLIEVKDIEVQSDYEFVQIPIHEWASGYYLLYIRDINSQIKVIKFQVNR